MDSNEETIEQVEGLRQHMKTLRQQMSDVERKMTEQDYLFTLAKMDQMLTDLRERIHRRNTLRKQAQAYNEAHKDATLEPQG